MPAFLGQMLRLRRRARSFERAYRFRARVLNDSKPWNRRGESFGCGPCDRWQTFSCAWGKAVLYCPTKISVQGEVKILTGGNGSGGFAATIRSPRALCRLGSLPRSARELHSTQGRPGGIPGPTVTVRMEEQGKHTRKASCPAHRRGISRRRLHPLRRDCGHHHLPNTPADSLRAFFMPGAGRVVPRERATDGRHSETKRGANGRLRRRRGRGAGRGRRKQLPRRRRRRRRERDGRNHAASRQHAR